MRRIANMGVYIHTPICSPGATSSAQARRVFKAGRLFSHLMADTEAELVDYAEQIGMRTRWLQDGGTRRAHFDVTGNFLAIVQRDSSVEKLTLREFVERNRGKAA